MYDQVESPVMSIVPCPMQTTSEKQSLPGGWRLHDINSNLVGYQVVQLPSTPVHLVLFIIDCN